MATQYTREQLRVRCGARPEELSQFEASGLLVPTRSRSWFGSKTTEYYTQDQLNVARWLVRCRRIAEHSQALGSKVCRVPVDGLPPAPTIPLRRLTAVG